MGKKLAAAATITGTGAAATTAATLATQGSESEELARINASKWRRGWFTITSV